MTDRVRGVTAHLCLVCMSAFAVVPIIYMYVTALGPRDEIAGSTLLPNGLSLDNYREAAADLPIWTLIVNTTIMAAGVAVGQLLVSLFAAYAFGMWRFRGERVLFVLGIATWLVPFQVTMIPNYVLLSDLGWLGSVVGVIVPQLTAPFAIVLLRQHMRSFPRELIDAARVDGRGPWLTLWTVVVPNLRAPLSAAAILLFVGAWNEYFWPLLVLRGQDSVVQIALKGFLSDVGNDYGALMAAASLLSLPVLLVYMLLRRHVVEAFVRSGLR